MSRFPYFSTNIVSANYVLSNWPLVKEIENLFHKDVTWQSTFFLSQQAFYLLWDQWLWLALLRLKGEKVIIVLIILLVTKPTMLVCQSTIKYLNMVLLESVKCSQVWQVSLGLFLLLLCIMHLLFYSSVTNNWRILPGVFVYVKLCFPFNRNIGRIFVSDLIHHLCHVIVISLLKAVKMVIRR